MAHDSVLRLSPTEEATSLHRELVERARALAPTLAARAPEATAQRRMPEATLAELRAAGLFKAVQPTTYGGYGLPPTVIYDIQLELGRGDASAAWVFGVLSVHSWQLALFPKQAQEDVWASNPDALIASSYMPVAKVEVVPGGVEISGRWSFSSGCDASEWIFLGGFVPMPDGGKEMRTFLLPMSDCTIVDNWYVSGLRASGSKDVIVEKAFVPDHRMHRFVDGARGKSPGNAIHTGVGYRLPFGQVHVRSVSTPALGAARGALEHYCASMRQKVSQATGQKAGENPRNAAFAAEAAAVLDREELVLRRNFAEMLAYLERGEEIPIERRVAFRHDSARAARAAVEVVDQLFRSYGARAIFLDDPINRHFLDVHAVLNHHANDTDRPSENFGGVLFGRANVDGFV